MDMRLGFVVPIAILTLGLIISGEAAMRTAHACSLGPPSAADSVQYSAIVAIGEFRETGEWEATFVVEDAIKGVEAGDELLIDNREPGLGADCSTYHDGAPGHKFAEGDRALVFLEEQVDGLWQLGIVGFGVFEVPPDDLAPLVMHGMPVASSPLTMDEVRRRVSEAPSISAEDAATRENELGCRPPYMFNPADLEAYAGIAQAVAIVETEPGGYDQAYATGPVKAMVREVLRDNLASSEITLNNRHISDYYTKDCVPAVEDGWRVGRGTTLLVFLIPDEFGVAEYRSVAWNTSSVKVNERYVIDSGMTVDELRRAAESGREGQVEDTPAALAEEESAATPNSVGATDLQAEIGDGGSNGLSLILLSTMAALIVAAALGAFALRRARSG